MLDTINAIADDAKGEIHDLRARFGDAESQHVNAGLRAVATGIVAAGQMIALAIDQSRR